jgi:hypothetical protein
VVDYDVLSGVISEKYKEKAINGIKKKVWNHEGGLE